MFATRRIEFSAAHVCRNPNLGDEENRRLYGASANPHGHGHNFVVDVTLEGEPNPATGLVFDLKDLKEILHREVVGPFDHRFLNREAPPFDKVIPTAENIAIEIWKRMAPYFEVAAARLYSVRVFEKDDMCVEYRGEGG